MCMRCVLYGGIVKKLLEHGLVSRGNVAMCAGEVEDDIIKAKAEFEATTKDLTEEQMQTMLEHTGDFNA